MVGIGNDRVAVVELDSETIVIREYFRDCLDLARLAILVEEIVADADISHRRPSRRCRERSIQGKGFPSSGLPAVSTYVCM
jgi:hypothetical protein